MIKVGIIGGSNPMAGELVRLLINHPDVMIMWVNSARYAGRLFSDVHHGLLGETDIRISPTADLDNIDVLFIFRHKGQTIEWLNERVIPDKLHIIDLSVDMQDPDLAYEHEFVYGLPELNRKVLVRGAKRTILPHPIASISALSLLPLAKEELLNGDIHVTISAPRNGEKPEVTMEDLAKEISSALRELQPTFGERITIEYTPDVHERTIASVTTLDVNLDIAELTRKYEEFYEDHNFIIVMGAGELETKEVEGTNKCLLQIDKVDGQLQVRAMMDALLKGAAGTAVHDMNLMFGLLERTGLALKASTY